VVWSTAYLDEAELCGEVVLLSAGKLLFNGPPRQLTGRVEHRSFFVTGVATGKRRLLTQLLDRPDVVDGVIQGAHIRVVLRERGSVDEIRSAAAAWGGAVEPTAPRFEDAFIDLLGGGPGGSSALAAAIPQKGHADGQAVVEARGLTKRFGPFTATSGVSFSVPPGEIFGLLGPNGAGKSTTFKMMCGLLKPSAGEALVAGISLSRAPGRARQRVGYMAQKFSLYGTLTARQNLDFFSGVYGLRGAGRRRQVARMIELFGLQPFLGQSSEGLPLGIKQRLALACAVMHAPDILFLDEPTSGVDPVTRREFWSHINGLVRKGVTIMVTTHFMDEAEYCDRIGLINQGELIALDTPQRLKESVASGQLPRPTLEDAFIELIRRRGKPEAAA
jgi:ABC-2 type transport system ATP-binding protein